MLHEITLTECRIRILLLFNRLNKKKFVHRLQAAMQNLALYDEEHDSQNLTGFISKHIAQDKRYIFPAGRQNWVWF